MLHLFFSIHTLFLSFLSLLLLFAPLFPENANCEDSGGCESVYVCVRAQVGVYELFDACQQHLTRKQ